MTDPISLLQTQPTTSSQPAAVQLFDPPMCCPTGLCGPTLDETLLNVSEMILALEADGVRVERYQMTSHPQSFLQNPDVMELVRRQEMDALPITVVNGRIVKSGAYPSLEEVQAALNGEQI